MNLYFDPFKVEQVLQVRFPDAGSRFIAVMIVIKFQGKLPDLGGLGKSMGEKFLDQQVPLFFTQSCQCNGKGTVHGVTYHIIYQSPVVIQPAWYYTRDLFLFAGPAIVTQQILDPDGVFVKLHGAPSSVL